MDIKMNNELWNPWKLESPTKTIVMKMTTATVGWAYNIFCIQAPTAKTLGRSMLYKENI